MLLAAAVPALQFLFCLSIIHSDTPHCQKIGLGIDALQLEIRSKNDKRREIGKKEKEGRN